MSKTLADMSIAEREACVGMWADIDPDPDRPAAWIVTDVVDTNKVRLINPATGDNARVGNYRVALLPDIPRAWGMDGQPPAGRYEEANGGWDDDLNEPYHWPMRSADCNENCSPFDKAPAEYSRWVSDWEPVPTPRKINGMVNEHV